MYPHPAQQQREKIPFSEKKSTKNFYLLKKHY
jgi:hypothetical protein